MGSPSSSSITSRDGKQKLDQYWWLQSISRPQPSRAPPIPIPNKTVLGSKFHWQILAPDATLLDGNTVDYALILNQLAPLTSMTTDWAVPWRPHCLLTYALELPDDFRNYNQLRTFPALPGLADPGFRPCTTYVSQVEDLTLYNAEPNPDWVSITEQYLLQQHP